MKKIILTFLFLTLFKSAFITEESDYNQTLSRIYVTYAAVAFCPSKCIQEWSCQTTKNSPKLVDVKYITSTFTKAVAYIGYNPEDKEIMIAWRGSNNTRNWIQDYNIQMESYLCRGCKVHVGFHFDYSSVEKKLVEKTEDLMLKYDVKRIICTGHSLGGSLSTINGIQFNLRYGTKYEVHVHNFGSPRIGDVNLAHFIDNKLKVHQRVVHYKDVAPHFPNEYYGYWHAAVEIFFNEQMTSYKVCNKSGEDKTCSDQYHPDYDMKYHDFYFIHISQVKC